MGSKTFLHIIGGITIAIIIILGVLTLNGLILYLAWNYLLLFLIPTFPTMTFMQAIVATIILSIIGSFFKTPLKYK